ncbi:helix-turn-helix domain-containing protein [Psychrobacter sp. I-STPA6b]|uniref:helix-turn-helix domain-containing protein n=1 Tax=Psychrobacter sp. I-STPA6b TaxID=2585718 RepID=UPI001D0CA1BD|nr:helix-turn-helix transcriptional regulator [Psychrobacter sp. I-STPA6b]
MEKVSQKIRLLRTANHLTQEEMALNLNMSHNGYAQIECGETSLTLAKLEQIANIFGISATELMTHGEKNVVYLTNENGSHDIKNSNSINFIQEHQDTEIDNLKNMLQLKDDLIEQQKKEIQSLTETINLLKQKISA